MIAFKNKPFCKFSIFHGFMKKIICYVQLLSSLTIKIHMLLVNAKLICKRQLGPGDKKSASATDLLYDCEHVIPLLHALYSLF